MKTAVVYYLPLTCRWVIEGETERGAKVVVKDVVFMGVPVKTNVDMSRANGVGHLLIEYNSIDIYHGIATFA